MKLYDIEGLACASCAASAQKVLGRTKGVKEVRVNYATRTAAIAVDNLDLKQLNTPLDKLGFKLHPKNKNAYKQRQERAKKTLSILKKQLLIGGVFSVPLFIIAMFIPDMSHANYIMFGLTVPVLLVTGQRFFVSAFKQATIGKVNMDSLVALGTGTAFLFSVFNTFFPFILEEQGLIPYVYFEAVGVLLVFILLGKYLETSAGQQTTSAIEGLLEMRVPTVQLLENGEEKRLPVEVVQIGDVLKIRPGDIIPLDGIIDEGTASIDESMLTGESIFIAKTKGDEVFGGTVLQQGSFNLKVTRIGEETVLSQIVRLVEQAQNTQVPVQQLVDKIAAIFVPTVIIIAVLTFIFWWMNGMLVEGVVNAIAVLVVACPCALGLATPTAITVGIGEAARKGILIKNVGAIENIAQIDVIVLDKTGTITEGKPQVVAMDWLEDTTKVDDALKQALLSLENESEHPIAQAVVEYYQKRGITPKMLVQDFNNYTGLGLTGIINGEQYWLGNRQLLEKHNILFTFNSQQLIEQYEAQAQTVIFFANSQCLLAIIGIEDQIKAHSKAAIAVLKQKEKAVYMLTGDNPRVAKETAEAVGIENYQAQVMPKDKIAFVQQLQQEGKNVMMVGDGINDAPALTQANVGVAMNSGTSIATGSADIVLQNNDLRQLSRIMTIGTKMLQVIRQNLFWAFIYNIVLIPIAIGVLYPWGVLLNPMFAGAAMVLSSFFVIMNSLRLKNR